MKRPTQYVVVMKPLKEEVYRLTNVKTVCTTYSKTWAWVVFIVKGWRMPPDYEIQIMTLRCDYGN